MKVKVKLSHAESQILEDLVKPFSYERLAKDLNMEKGMKTLRHPGLEKIVKLTLKHPQEMNRQVVAWFRKRGFLKGPQRFEETRFEPWTRAAIDRGLGDSQVTARLLSQWVQEVGVA